MRLKRETVEKELARWSKTRKAILEESKPTDGHLLTSSQAIKLIRILEILCTDWLRLEEEVRRLSSNP